METKLLAAAQAARDNAYAPYSKFKVGAAVETVDGEIFTGCNIENASYGLTCCAERNAVFAAVCSGVRRFKTLCVVADTDEPVAPCGACRQVLAEFPFEKITLSGLPTATIKVTGRRSCAHFCFYQTITNIFKATRKII